MMTLLLAAALTVTGGVALDRRATIALDGAAVRIGDVVAGVAGPAAAIEIARLPAGRSSMTITRRAVAALVRRALPGVVIDGDGPAMVVTRRTMPQTAAARCFVARDAIAAGETIGADRVRLGSCESGAMPVRYDGGTGATVATRRIAEGEVVGHALPRVAPAIARGDALTLVARSGAVIVERQVAALQPGLPGGRVFVRAADERPFAAPVAEAQP